MGNRIAKYVIPRLEVATTGIYAEVPESDWGKTYYSRDASGNILATYMIDDINNPPIDDVEFSIYGSSRLGTQKYSSSALEEYSSTNTTETFYYESVAIVYSQITAINGIPFGTGNIYGYQVGDVLSMMNGEIYTINSPPSFGASNDYFKCSVTSTTGMRSLFSNSIKGRKSYELSNHLGNVMVTVSDKRLGVDDGTGKAGFYLADVTSATDYYPFGSVQPGRSFNSGEYRFGYQGSEKDNDIAQDNYTTHFRMLDTRLGRWFSIDPVFQPSQSPYCSMDNNPIFYNDILGDSVNTGNLYAKGNESQAEAFELFASTKEGEKYILDRAQKGFKLEGKYVDGLNIEASENGSKHNKGIDVTFNTKNLGSNSGLLEHTVKNNRLKLDVSIDNSNNSTTGTPLDLLEKVATYAHESMYHGEYYESRFGQFQKGLVSLNQNGTLSTFKSALHQLDLKTTSFGRNGLSILQQAQSKLKVSNVATNYYLISRIESYIHKYNWSCKGMEEFMQRQYKPLNKGLNKADMEKILLDGLPNDSDF